MSEEKQTYTLRVVTGRYKILASDGNQIATVDTANDADIVLRALNLQDELVDELRSMSARFERCAVHVGSDPEMAKVATSKARDLLSRAESK